MAREPIGTGGAKSEGTWKLSNDGFCTTWKGSKANCFRVAQAGDNQMVDLERHHQDRDLVEITAARNPETFMPNRRQMLAASVASLVTTMPRARAQAVNKPVRIIVGFPAGGGTDTIARILAERLRGSLRIGRAGGEQARRIGAARRRIRQERRARRQRAAVHARFYDDNISPQLPRAELRPGAGFHLDRAGRELDADLQYRSRCPGERQDARRLHRLVQSQPGQSLVRDDLGRRHTALRRHDAGERGARADDGGALPRRRTGATGPVRRPRAGEHQSDQRDAAVRARRDPCGSWR